MLALTKLGSSEQQFLASLPGRSCHFLQSSKAVIKCSCDTVTATILTAHLGIWRLKGTNRSIPVSFLAVSTQQHLYVSHLEWLHISSGKLNIFITATGSSTAPGMAKWAASIGWPGLTELPAACLSIHNPLPRAGVQIWKQLFWELQKPFEECWLLTCCHYQTFGLLGKSTQRYCWLPVSSSQSSKSALHLH